MAKEIDKKALVTFLVMGLVAGYLASLIVGSSSYALVGYLFSGVLGSFVGGFILDAAGIKLGISNKMLSQIATSTIGAIVVILLGKLIL